MTASYDNPPHLTARATVVVLPGRGEDASVYERLGVRLAFDAYRVRVLDDPNRDPAATEAAVKALLADEDAAAPHVLLGSDTGALFAALLVAQGSVAVDGLILSGLPVDRAPDGTPDWDAELAIRTTCPTHQNRLANDADFQRGALWNAPPSDWVEGAKPAAISIPVLGVHGAADTLSTVDDVRGWYGQLPHGELVSIADTAHDALNNQTHRTAATVVVAFLERLRLGADLPAIATVEVRS
ncbi:alpha/beta hydrolase [Actinokineospora diospyrosa]|uniref:Lysophospholipase, alpha-beta hydrolase superfamily n=1 Tax=Actinokineospora diospyrosa TaxID=103728 RepID=A0ABT1IMK1_9PSEU|nr:lysophospholipase [Actinokineospora diospyrosa]MCP2273875.1 Lysophospholipase, alpha-beta hydrolase superfamily [Actinokineospora diospyrosa]